ncbi:MAG: hypothetical protein QME96_16465, partial [Myxococcota bacterium]|nr:hypothetical protein [Myxococcota bacterium]
ADAAWPLREHGRRLVAAEEASRTAADRHDIVVVLDRSVVRLFEDGSSETRVHRIVRLDSERAVATRGHVEIPERATILTLRSIAPDGSVLPAHERHGPSGYALGGPLPGRYVEVEYAVADPASGMFSGGAVLPPFFFAAADGPLRRAELLVVHPRSVAVRFDAGPGAPPAQTAAVEGLSILRWVARDVAPAPLEPWAPDPEDALPNVRVCAGCSVERAAAHIAERLRRAGRTAPEMADLVRSHPDRRDLYASIQADVVSAPSPHDTAASVFLRRRGDRTMLLYHLERLAGRDVEVWHAAPLGRGDPPPGLWFPGDYAVPLLRSGDVWIYADEDGVPFGVLPPNVAGRPAIRVAPSFAEGVVGAGRESGATEYDIRFERGAAGGWTARIAVRLRGLPAVVLRQSRGSTAARAEREARTFALWMFDPAAAIDEIALEIPEDGETTPSVTAGVMLHGVRGPHEPPRLPMRWVSRFAFMPWRSQALVLPVGVAEEWTISYPPDPTPAVLAAPARIETPFGAFRQRVERDDTGAIVVRRTASVPVRRIEPADYPAFRAFAARVDAASETAP